MFGLKGIGKNNASGRTASSPATEAGQTRPLHPSLPASGPLAGLPKREKQSSFAGCMPSMPRVNIFASKKKSEKITPEVDIRAQLDANLKVRLGLERAGMAKAHAAALAKAEGVANAGGTSEELLHALDHTLSTQKRKTTPQERTHLKYATFAQVASTHYTVASRFHGDAHAELSSHNLPKAVQNGDVPPSEMSRDELKGAIADATNRYQDPLHKAERAFNHINGQGLATSPFVSVAEDPVTFARMNSPAAQNIVKNAPAVTTYMIPNQHLTRSEDIEREFLADTEIPDMIAEGLGLETIFHKDPRSGKDKLYEDESFTVATREALFMADKHLDTYAIDRSKNPYSKPPEPPTPAHTERLAADRLKNRTTLRDLFAAADAEAASNAMDRTA